jgi:beta-lactamase regulating signal transducer with metallopeptidase domain
MSLDLLAAAALRGAVLLALALLAMPLLRRAPASARRLVLALALGGALVLPAVSALAPALRVEAPARVAALRGHPTLEPLAEGGGAPAPAIHPAAAAQPAARFDVAPILLAVWALGALLVVARLAVGLARSRAMVRRSTPAPAWAAASARAARLTGLRAEVRATGDMDAPAVTGVISPVVLVPHASASWSDARRLAVLLHELAHVRQQDCLAQIVAQLACALHWFDPLAWMAARRLRVERELAADDAVLAAGARASSYAEDLLAIAGIERRAPAGTLGMAERSTLAARITAIVAPGRARGPISAARAALVAAGVLAVLFVVACTSPTAPAPRPAAAPVLDPAPPPAPVTAGSTIDARLQRIADEELDRTMAEWQGQAGAILVLDPSTGEILANAGRAGGAPSDVAVRRAYVTGSTLKTVLLAAALSEGVITPADRFDCENGARWYGKRKLYDAGYGTLTVPEMLAVSTNIGFSKIFDRLGGDRFGSWLARFHFGAAPPIPGATAGDLPGRLETGSFEGAVAAIGEAMAASPLQVAAAYAAIANDGVYVAPTLVRRASPPREPILKPEVARTVIGMLEGVVTGERSTGKLAAVAGVRVAGKTGTAEWDLPGGGRGIYASFVGMVPVERPRFVILVGVEGPRDGGSGGKVAAPAFARVAARAL